MKINILGTNFSGETMKSIKVKAIYSSPPENFDFIEFLELLMGMSYQNALRKIKEDLSQEDAKCQKL